jgi:hypothetical protein
LCSYDNKTHFYHEWIGHKKKTGSDSKKVKFLTDIYPNRKIDINLFKEKNASTFLHEMGHVYFAAMAHYVSIGRANEQMTKDLQVMLDFVGAKDFSQVTEDQHEKIAKAFEVYLFQGKAPSTKLKNVFRRIKAWLNLIYKDISALGVEINEDIKQVFDRMVATDAEIAQAYGMPEFKAIIDQKSAEGLGMSEDEFNRLKSLKDAAVAESKERLTAKVLTDFMKDKRLAIKAEKEAAADAKFEEARQALFAL